MATVFKKREWIRIPESAAISTKRGREYAQWIDEAGDVVSLPVVRVPSDAKVVGDKRGRRWVCWRSSGDRVRVLDTNVRDGMVAMREAKAWTITYFDENGVRRERAAGKLKERADDMAAKIKSRLVQIRAGIIDPAAEARAEKAKLPLTQHIEGFRAWMVSSGAGEKHIRTTIMYVEAIAKARRWSRISDISAQDVSAYAEGLAKRKLGPRTLGAYIAAAKAFSRHLVRNGDLPADPLAWLKKPDPEKDRRRRRRAALPEEFRRLLRAAESGPVRFGMDGWERSLCYRTAVETGLRSSELGSLTRGSVVLDVKQPYILARASDTKNSRPAQQFIRPSLAEDLREHLKNKLSGAGVFAMPERAAEMLREDLEAARAVWIEEAKADPEEHARREASDFLRYTDHEGETLDFHALRHTCGAWAAMGGAHPKAVQTLMRHSSITLTMDRYGHLFPGQAAQTVHHLPSFEDAKMEAKAAGTA